jgi:hypothetical protein
MKKEIENDPPIGFIVKNLTISFLMKILGLKDNGDEIETKKSKNGYHWSKTFRWIKNAPPFSILMKD